MLLLNVAAADQITYVKDIKGIVARQCLGCHGNDSAPEYAVFKKEKDMWMKRGKGARMDTYSHLVHYTAWPNTGALMRRLDDGLGSSIGKAGNMYQHLGADEVERQKHLALFNQWIGSWSLKRFPDMTKEEVAEIRVHYIWAERRLQWVSVRRSTS